MAEPLIIVGKGMAATRLVDELSQRALGRHAIAVIGEEPRLAYNRVLLSPLLAGEIAEADLELKPAAWWRARGVSTFYGHGVTAIDRAARTVPSRTGERCFTASSCWRPAPGRSGRLCRAATCRA